MVPYSIVSREILEILEIYDDVLQLFVFVAFVLRIYDDVSQFPSLTVDTISSCPSPSPTRSTVHPPLSLCFCFLVLCFLSPSSCPARSISRSLSLSLVLSCYLSLFLSLSLSLSLPKQGHYRERGRSTVTWPEAKHRTCLKG